MLEIKSLNVNLKEEKKEILKDFNLKINDGEVHAIMGPNGTGKSTLARSIMGYYKFQISAGEIIFNGKKINDMSVDERAKMGIFLAMQEPTSIEGVKNSEFLKTAKQEITGNHINYFDFINLVNNSLNDLEISKDMIHRDLNVGFSGGEKKKNEILQIKVLEPKLIILDEIDSGLDVDSLKIVCNNIISYKKDHPFVSMLIITHYPRILEFLKPDYVHIMNHGKIVETGNIDLAMKTEEMGYHE